jgi:hypothetical protein
VRFKWAAYVACLSICAGALPVLAAEAFGGYQTRKQGGIVGRVFIDRDGDGAWSSGDRALEGARIFTATGDFVFTDSDGRYHLLLLSTGNEVLASHVIKLDLSTIPAGTLVMGSHRRLIELTPQLFVRQDFALQTEKAEAPQSRGIESAGRAVQAMLRPSADGSSITTLLAGITRPGCKVFVEAKQADVSKEGLYQIEVDIQPGVNSRLVTVHCQDGHLEFLLSEIHWVRRTSGGDMIFPATPKSLAVCQAPGIDEIPLTQAIDLSCRIGPGVALNFGGRQAENQSSRPTDAALNLAVKPGLNSFDVSLRLAHSAEYITSLGWRVSRVSITGAVLGSLSFSYGDGLGFLGGKLRGHMQAQLPEDFKLILGGGLDLSDKEGISAADILEPAWDPWVLKRDPDPESTYPITGDSSLLGDSNPASSRYVLKLKRKKSFLGWGSFQTNDKTRYEIGSYKRTLLGAHARINPFEDLFDEDLPVFDLALEGYYARPSHNKAGTIPSLASPDISQLGQMPAHEEFLATGGTLYFLGHNWLVEGSTRVSVNRRDSRTGFTLEHLLLRPGIDYQVDVTAGRVLLSEPLESGFSSSAPVRLTPTGTTTTVLVVDYEYLDIDESGLDGVAGGQAAITVNAGSGISISGAFTAAAQGLESKSYRLYRGETRVHFGNAGELWAGYGLSDGIVLNPAYSVDGGISFLRPDLPVSGSGEAYEAGARLNLSFLKGQLLFRRYLAGFADSNLVATTDLTQAMATLVGKPLESLEILGRFSGTGQDLGRYYEGSLGLRYRVIEDLVLAAQGTFDYGDGGNFGDGYRSVAGLKAAYRALAWLTLTAGHQHTLVTDGTGPTSRDMTLSTLGTELRLWDRYQVGVEAGYGHEVGNLVSFSLREDRPQGGSVFANTTFSIDRDAVRSGSLTSGQAVPAGGGVLLTTSQTVACERGQSARGQQLGVEIPISDPWRLKLGYQRTELENPGNADFKRDHSPTHFSIATYGTSVARAGVTLFLRACPTLLSRWPYRPAANTGSTSIYPWPTRPAIARPTGRLCSAWPGASISATG